MRRTSLLFLMTTCMHQILFMMLKFCSGYKTLCSSGLTFCSQRDMHLFAVIHTFELYEKNIWKIKFSKYSQVWSCFKNLDIRNTMAQSKFNFDIHYGIYGFFLLQNYLHVGNVIILSFLHVHTCPFLSACKQ